MIKAATYARLLTAISADVETRIYPGVAPKLIVPPLCVYNSLSQEIPAHLDGPSVLRWTKLQVDIYSYDPELSTTIAEKVVQSLAAWRDNGISVTIDLTGVDFVDSTVEPYLFKVASRFTVHHYGA